MSFSREQIEQLKKSLDPADAKQRSQSGRDLSYIEGWHAIEMANNIFGYDGWGYDVRSLVALPMADGSGVTYQAIVTVRVDACRFERTDVGCGVIRDGQQKNTNNPEQHEQQMKAAVTDALKRALRSFGDQFGNRLYEKDGQTHQEIKKALRDPDYTLRQEVTQMLENNAEAKRKLQGKKPPASMNHDELVRCRAWLLSEQEKASAPRSEVDEIPL